MTPKEAAAIETAKFVERVNEAILFPLIALLSGIALLFFLYGAAEYIMNAANDQGREQGKKHLFYGIIGLVIMLSAYTILSIAAGTFGLRDELECSINPSLSGCP